MKSCVVLLLVLSTALIFSVPGCKKTEIQEDGVKITVDHSTAERSGTGIRYAMSFHLTAIRRDVNLNKVHIAYSCNGTVTDNLSYDASEILDTTHLAPGVQAHSPFLTYSSDDLVNINTSITVSINYIDSDNEHHLVKIESDIPPPADTPIIEYFESNGHYMSPGDTLMLKWRVENADEISIIWETGELEVDAEGEIQLDPFDGGESPICYVLETENKKGVNRADIIIFLE